MSAVIARENESSDQNSEPIPSKSQNEPTERSAFSASSHAQKYGLPDTEHGWLNSELEQREARTWAYQAGMKRGAAAFFQSTLMENLAVEIKILRVLNDELAKALTQCQWERDHWRSKFADCVRVIGSPKR